MAELVDRAVELLRVGKGSLSLKEMSSILDCSIAELAVKLVEGGVDVRVGNTGRVVGSPRNAESRKGRVLEYLKTVGSATALETAKGAGMDYQHAKGALEEIREEGFVSIEKIRKSPKGVPGLAYVLKK